jgi:hypothetical protein
MNERHYNRIAPGVVAWQALAGLMLRDLSTLRGG